MSSQLDPDILAAITAEARQCFLDEDAPLYLQMLSEGFQNHNNIDFKALLRAAHSLKGGAGLASLSSLQSLAHQLEDVLVALQQNKIAETDLALALVEKSIEEIEFVLSQARTVDTAIADPELLVALSALVGDEQHETAEDDAPHSDNSHFICNTLTLDLENSFAAVEELELDTPDELVQPLVSSLIDECTFLAETLELPWLASAFEPVKEVQSTADATEILLLTQEIIGQLREKITEYLSNIDRAVENPATSPANHESLVANTLNEDLESWCEAIAELPMDTPEATIQEAISNFAEQCSFLGETLDLPWLNDAVAPIENILAQSDPVEALLTVQEIVTQIRQQRLYLQGSNIESDAEAMLRGLGGFPHERLHQEAIALDNNIDTDLLELDNTDTFSALPEEDAESKAMFAPPTPLANKTVEIAASQSAANTQIKISLEELEDMTNNVEELILNQSRIRRQQQVLNQANRRLRDLTRQFEPIREQVQNFYNQLAINTDMASKVDSVASSNAAEFDSLEMDRYTDVHLSLQSFQELMLQIQETYTDIDFIDRQLFEDLERGENNLNTLYSQVTDSRLVPFNSLGKRFIPQISGLARRFDKSVDLKIEGQNTLVDRLLLEQLQTPLTHLLNNAFDHGIESKYERIATDKPETASIILSAQLKNNQLVIKIIDDGGGINPEKVYQRAVERGICPPDKSISEFKSEEIIDWIFEPDFSTAAKVSDISGRGMGLDIVLNQIRQLRGQLLVTTDVGIGTTFTISLPLNLSLQYLLLLQLENRLIAIPHISVLEILSSKTLSFTTAKKQQINWQNKIISLASVTNLFPCPKKPLQTNQGNVAIVLETAFEPVAILVDAIVGEEKLIIKPFDETIPVPTYIAGCTVLGTGEIVPVILPQGIGKDAGSLISVNDSKATIFNTTSTILVAEDSVATRRMLDKILTSVGYQVIVCRDGQEALEQVEQNQGRIDLILSDVEMPRLNGFELLEKVRSLAAFKNTPVVMATSRTGERHQQRAKRLGATEYLGKPIQPQQLIDTVAALLKK